jgi:hypothetical protein
MKRNKPRNADEILLRKDSNGSTSPTVIKQYHVEAPKRPPKRTGKRVRRNWTEEEDRILRRSYTKRGSRYVAELLGRTIASVQARALTLGVPGHGIRMWTEMEQRYLRTRYQTFTAEQIARTLRRTEESVRGQIHHLGLGTYSPTPWTEAEVEYLRAHYGKAPVCELAVELGRTTDAVELKARKLGINRRVVKLSEADIRWIIENLGKIPFTKMAAKLGVEEKRLARIAAKHGYRARPNNRAWTPEEDAFVRENYGSMSRKEMAERLNRRVELISWRARKLGLVRKREDMEAFGEGITVRRDLMAPMVTVGEFAREEVAIA